LGASSLRADGFWSLTPIPPHLTHLTCSLDPDPRGSAFPRWKFTAQASPGLDVSGESVQKAAAVVEENARVSIFGLRRFRSTSVASSPFRGTRHPRTASSDGIWGLRFRQLVAPAAANRTRAARRIGSRHASGRFCSADFAHDLIVCAAL
jgi:hypothetical protein